MKTPNNRERSYDVDSYKELQRTHYPVTQIPFWEEMRAEEVLWQRGDQMDLETSNAAVVKPVREIHLPI